MNMIRRLPSVLLMLLAAAALPAAAQGETEALEQKVALAMQAEDWEGAADHLAELIAVAPDNAAYRANYGRALRNLGDLEGALIAYEQSLALLPGFVNALSGSAVVLERLERVEEAFQRLELAAENGLPVSVLETSPGFAEMRNYKGRFARALGVAKRRANPCRQEGPYDDFDFWVGEWDVYVDGVQRASSSITKELNGCLIRERYTNRQGFQGESLNFWDPEIQQWRQHWIDKFGAHIWYTGAAPRVGIMEMEGANTDARGRSQQARVTWTKQSDGTVKHEIVQSLDGEVWQPYFLGTYVPKGKPLPGR